MDQLLQNYIKSFRLHVGTKTTDIVLHEFLAKIYEFKFHVLHKISEKRQDLGIDPSIDCDKAAMSMITLLESEKTILENMVKEKNSVGMDNLLRSLLDELEGLIGTAKGFSEYEEEKEDDEKPKLGIKSGLIKK